MSQLSLDTNTLSWAEETIQKPQQQGLLHHRRTKGPAHSLGQWLPKVSLQLRADRESVRASKIPVWARGTGPEQWPPTHALSLADVETALKWITDEATSPLRFSMETDLIWHNLEVGVASAVRLSLSLIEFYTQEPCCVAWDQFHLWNHQSLDLKDVLLVWPIFFISGS